MTAQAAAIQFLPARGRASENRHRSIEFISRAAHSGARIIVLPELAISGYVLDAQLLNRVAEPINGPTLAAWTEIASHFDIVIAGGFCEREGTRLFNSAILVGPRGLLHHYRKLHLFDKEKLVFAAGDRGLSVTNTPFGKIGLCVCYDLRFVEVMRALSLLNADIVAVPTAWVGGFDNRRKDAEGLIGQARGAVVQANLNQVYVVCASQAGVTSEFSFLGSSLIADPYGEILGGPLPADIEDIVVAPVDPRVVQASLSRSDLVKPRQDRRVDVYHVGIKGHAL